ncbi:MAG: hypothetical protein ABIG71_02205 [Candidatus Uhrbacteria bacterium]
MPTIEPITYPSLAERLHELRKDGLTFKDMAGLLSVPVREETIIGWSEGVQPGKQLLGAISVAFDHDFIQHNFALAAQQANFPNAQTPQELLGIRSQPQLVAFLRPCVDVVAQKNIARFFGWVETSFSSFMTKGGNAFDRDRLATVLARLPEFLKHTSGEIISACTPRVILGRTIRECRQARGESRPEYGRRIPEISENVLRSLEDEGRGLLTPSRKAAMKGGQRTQPGFFRDDATLEQLVEFLNSEREALAGQLDGQPSSEQCTALTQESELEPKAEVLAPSTSPMITLANDEFDAGSEEHRESLANRLRPLVQKQGCSAVARMFDIPRRTLQRFINHPKTTLDTTVRTIAERVDGIRGEDAAPRGAPEHGTPGGDLRIVQLDATVRALTGRVEQLLVRLDGTPAADAGAPSAAQPFPFTRERFTEHDDTVSAQDLARIAERIRQVIVDLAYCAAVHDAQCRKAVRLSLSPAVNDLFNAIEAFSREHPIASLRLIERQRAWVSQQQEEIDQMTVDDGQEGGE